MLASGRTASYTRPVAALPVWIDWSDYMCCGTPRRVGEMATLEVTFAGAVEATGEPDRLSLLGDGGVVIAGAAVGPVAEQDNHTDGTTIRCGDVEFAIEGAAPGPRVRCDGRLYEMRHGFPCGRTTGKLIGIRWRPHIMREIGEGTWETAGYGSGEEHASTEDWRSHQILPDADNPFADAWSLVLTLDVRGPGAPGRDG